MKLIFYIFGTIAFTFLLLIGLLLFAVGIVENIIFMLITGIVIIIVSVIGIVFIFKRNAHIKDNYLQNKEKKYRRIKYKFNFVSGLPLMPGALCKVFSTTDKLIIEGQGTVFELNKESITSIAIEKNTTISTQALSSAGGAIAGAMVFGALGAAIGGRTTSRKVKSIKRYIVITYLDIEQCVKYIIFDYNDKGTYLVKDFKTFNKDTEAKKIVKIN